MLRTRTLRTRTSRTTTRTQGRRGAVTAASAAVVCLGVTLAGCGGGGRDGYAAVGGVPSPAGSAGAPTGAVRMVPLDGPTSDSNSSSGRTTSDTRSETPPSGTPSAGASTAPDSSTPDPADTSPSPTGAGTTAPEQPSSTPTPGRTKPPAPADLSWGDPSRKDTDKRWCEKVTVGFHNSGGTAVRSGTVTFGTHIIGALGIDWGTVESTADLPVPIGPGARTDHTWTVCVDAWRVPLGMHIETRDVSVRWK
ncbi:hypothetical protein ACFWIO_29110 [Streptomyces diastatochromogenes]|uniref:hypothetical protein n=1 Tax=Streptomyces diastatochromogenes TaxID=42236 RepID=UPI0036667A5A